MFQRLQHTANGVSKYRCIQNSVKSITSFLNSSAKMSTGNSSLTKDDVKHDEAEKEFYINIQGKIVYL